MGDGLNVLADLLPSDSDFEDIVEHRELLRLVDRTLASFPDREDEVVVRHFGIGGAATETLEEIGWTWGVTRERVRQVEIKTLEHLRARERGEPLRQFAVEQ